MWTIAGVSRKYGAQSALTLGRRPLRCHIKTANARKKKYVDVEIIQLCDYYYPDWLIDFSIDCIVHTICFASRGTAARLSTNNNEIWRFIKFCDCWCGLHRMVWFINCVLNISRRFQTPLQFAHTLLSTRTYTGMSVLWCIRRCTLVWIGSGRKSCKGISNNLEGLNSSCPQKNLFVSKLFFGQYFIFSGSR